jgi:hypothetical protein
VLRSVRADLFVERISPTELLLKQDTVRQETGQQPFSVLETNGSCGRSAEYI